MVTSSSQKNLYWCVDNVYTGWTSLYFKPDSSMHMRIKYTGIGNWQYTGDGTWYIINRYREQIISVFTKNGYRIKEISASEAAGRQRVQNARKGSQRGQQEEQRSNQREEEEREYYRRRRQERERQERRREREEEERRRRRSQSNNFNDFSGFFGNGQTSNSSSTLFKNIEQSWINVFKSLNKDLAKKMYRQICLVLHPDKSGDEEAMKVLNSAWSKFEKEN